MINIERTCIRSIDWAWIVMSDSAIHYLYMASEVSCEKRFESLEFIKAKQFSIIREKVGISSFPRLHWITKRKLFLSS